MREDYLDTCTPFELMFGQKAVLPVDLHCDNDGIGAEEINAKGKVKENP